jgi:hypothetical protein
VHSRAGPCQRTYPSDPRAPGCRRRTSGVSLVTCGAGWELQCSMSSGWVSSIGSAESARQPMPLSVGGTRSANADDSPTHPASSPAPVRLTRGIRRVIFAHAGPARGPERSTDLSRLAFPALLPRRKAPKVADRVGKPERARKDRDRGQDPLVVPKPALDAWSDHDQPDYRV